LMQPAEKSVPPRHQSPVPVFRQHPQAAQVPDVGRLAAAEPEQLGQINGIGPSVSASIREFFADPENQALVADLLALGIGTAPKRADSDLPRGTKLAGQSFVITGTLSQPRRYFEELIEQNGGRIADSVTSKITYLVCGESPGSKLEKARKLGVGLLDEEQLRQLVGDESN